MRTQPDVHDGRGQSLRFWRQFASEDLAEEGVHDRVKPILGKPVPIIFGLPNVDVAQPALGHFDRHMADQALRRLVAESLFDPGVERRVDGDTCTNVYAIVVPPINPN